MSQPHALLQQKCICIAASSVMAGFPCFQIGMLQRGGVYRSVTINKIEIQNLK